MRRPVWQVYYVFSLVSGGGRFSSKYNCLATNDVGAWTQVASTTSGHNPPIEEIKLISKETLYEKSDEELLVILRSLKNL